MESIIMTGKMVHLSRLKHPARLSDTSKVEATGQQNMGFNQILIPT